MAIAINFTPDPPAAISAERDLPRNLIVIPAELPNQHIILLEDGTTPIILEDNITDVLLE